MIFDRIRKYNKYRNTVRELNNLSDRELSDLGISRFEIPGIARQAVKR